MELKLNALRKTGHIAHACAFKMAQGTCRSGSLFERSELYSYTRIPTTSSVVPLTTMRIKFSCITKKRETSSLVMKGNPIKTFNKPQSANVLYKFACLHKECKLQQNVEYLNYDDNSEQATDLPPQLRRTQRTHEKFTPYNPNQKNVWK